MLFNSWTFLAVFLPIVLAGYWLARATVGARAGLGWLAAASLAFWLTGEPHWPALLASSIACNLLAARALARLPDGGARRLLFIAALAGNLATLVVFKYLNWLTDSLAPLLGNTVTALALPVGISFFTFTQIAFLVDTWHRKVDDFDPLRYLLFVTYFPHLIAGPILHHAEMIPQFARAPAHAMAGRLWSGAAMFAIGLAKKVLVADPLAPVADALFAAAGAGEVPGAAAAWAGALAYAAQIYFDFSGYSDMAIGLSRLFGIDLPVNFASPYRAASITEFWRRWHITLSRFLRDYLYIPLGGNRHGASRRALNLMTTMLLGGLWHGAGWPFLAWGGLHGAMLAGHQAWVRLRGRIGWGPMPVWPARLLTLVAVTLAWVPFRAPDFGTAWRVWQGMAGAGGLALAEAAALDGRKALLLLAAALAVALLAPNSQTLMRRWRMGLASPGYPSVDVDDGDTAGEGASDGAARSPGAKHASVATPVASPGRRGPFGLPGRLTRLAAPAWRPTLLGALALGLLLGLAMRRMGEPSAFIYFRF